MYQLVIGLLNFVVVFKPNAVPRVQNTQFTHCTRFALYLTCLRDEAVS